MPVTGWDAIQPDHKPMCELIVHLAEVALADAWRNHDDLVEHRAELERPVYLGRKANLLTKITHARDELEHAQAARAEYYQTLPGCTCTPVSDACPVCLAANAVRYGDEIPA
jgi:hypothetical protein